MASLGQLRKALIVTLATAAGIALLSCSAQQPSSVPSSTSSTAFEPYSSVVRAPLSNSPPLTPYDPINEGTEPVGTWRASPRWSAVQGDGCIVVDQPSSAQGNIDFENCRSDEVLDDQTPAGAY
jgi:hypothetical protein